jgi:protein subunit release factor A
MDLRVDYYDNASPGDNYRVTCRIVHIPSGVVEQSDDQRNRMMAKRQAYDRLLAKLT